MTSRRNAPAGPAVVGMAGPLGRSPDAHRVPGASSPDVAGTPGTRARILAAAYELALDVGFRRTTIADIARRAGMSRMTVYREFADLPAIWSRLLTDELVGALDRTRVAMASVPTARARTVAMAVALVELLPQHPLFRRALELDPQVLLPLVVTRFGSTQQATLAEIHRLIAAGQVDGSIRADLDVDGAAGAILMTAQSFIFSARAIDTLPDPAAVRAELPVIIERYLAP